MSDTEQQVEMRVSFDPSDIRREGRRIYNRERALRSLAECENEAFAAALTAAHARGRREGLEEAAQYHDRESERIGQLLNSPRSACNSMRMIEAIGDHENFATELRSLIEASEATKP